MVKSLITFLGFGLIASFLFFYYKSPLFNHYLNLLIDSHNTKNIIYKEISKSTDLNDHYPFTIKHPEIYAISLTIKKNTQVSSKNQDWLESPPLVLNIQVINSKNKTIFSKTINKYASTGFSHESGEISYTLVDIPLQKCTDCTLKLKVLNGNLLKYENKKGLIYFSMHQSGVI